MFILRDKWIGFGKRCPSGDHQTESDNMINPPVIQQTEANAAEARFIRAATSFEAILLSQIDVKKELTQRLNYAIRAGIIIPGIIAISILILLLTLSAQIGRISGVVKEMNKNFASVAEHMTLIKGNINSMESRVALMEGISHQTAVIDNEMNLITGEMRQMVATMNGIKRHVTDVHLNVDNISNTINHMDANVQLMGHDMSRMGQPARSLNNMFPFP
ncbi:conserved hypothetical protein [Gammaproteobacteria bacterium]